MKKKIIVLFVAITLFITQGQGQGFLKCNGQNIVDSLGKNVLLRGIGLGGWMLQEGYMMNMNAFANIPYLIRNKIASVLESSKTEQFYQKWLNNYIQKEE